MYEHKRGVNSLVIKLVAMFAMLVDHVGVIILSRWGMQYDTVSMMDFSNPYSALYSCARLFGRLAFPLYIFLLVEGFEKTSNRLKYFINLLIFAAISEVPFDLAIRGEIFYPKYNNVMITLLLGFLAIWTIELILQSEFLRSFNKPTLVYVIIVLSIVFYMSIAGLVHSDYRYYGVAAIVAMYLVRKQNILLAFVFTVIVLTFSNETELAAIFGLPLILFYNGDRGFSSKILKYVFYWFYPVHFLAIWLVQLFIDS